MKVMKNIFRIVVLLLCVPFVTKAHEEKLLVVGLLLDNEEYGILDTIKPLVEGGIDTFVLLDTGRAPTTLEIIHTFFKQAAIDPIIIYTTSSDDDQLYNHLIEYAQATCTQVPFILLPTPGWRLNNANGLLQFCKQVRGQSCPFYYIRIVRDTLIECYLPCLVRCSSQGLFKGLVHAQPCSLVEEKVPDDIYFEYHSIHYGIMPYKNRLLRDKQVLLHEYHRNPHDPHTLFHLAQTLALLGEHDQAYRYYELCANIRESSEVIFLALCRLGQMIERLSQPHSHDCGQLALHYYLKAHEILPNRAEPLVRIAQYYALQGTMELAFFFAHQAAFVPYPTTALYAVEKEIYEYVRYDLLGQYAWYVGNFDVGEWAVRKALQARPQQEHLTRNLQFYVNRTIKSCPKNVTDFIESMSHGASFNKTFLETDAWAQKVQEQYTQFIARAAQHHDIAPRIPKIIHQIWLGSSFPLRCKALQSSWHKHHPDWEYRLWTDDDIAAFQLSNQKAYDAALTYGEKSDIARYEILYRCGGLYIDTDFECVRSFDLLHQQCDFYAGLENGECLVGNSLIGSAPGNPILKKCIETLQCAAPGESGWQYTCNRTGPGHITRCIKECIMKEDVVTQTVIFPTGYFFPWYPYFGEIRTAEKALMSLRPETYAVHHWHSSWVK